MTNQQFIEQGQRLKIFRKKISLNQVELAELLDATQSYLSDIEKGKKGISRSLLTKITERYPDFNTTWLLTGQGDMDVNLSFNHSHNKYFNDSYVSESGSSLTVEESLAEYQTTDIQSLLIRIQKLENFIRNKFPDF